jgi:tetratricopeptide (TPR) repeat protein
VLEYLLEATQACPTHSTALYQLCILLEAAEEPRALAELLEEAARSFLADETSSADAPEGRNREAHALYRRAEDLYRFRLDQPLEALRVARKARELDPGDETANLAHVRLLDEAAVRSQRLDLKHEAAEAWLAVAEKEPALLDAERRLRALRSELGHARLARVHAEIILAYGEASDAEKRAFELEFGDGQSAPPPVAKEGEPVSTPEHPAEASPLARLFELLGYHVLSALEGDLPEPRPKKRDRVKIPELDPRVAGPILDIIDLFGVTAPNVYVKEEATRPLQASFVDGRPALLVCPSLAERELESVLRFWVGSSLSLLRPRALAISVLPLDLLRDALEGVVRERVPGSKLYGDPKLLKKRGKALEKVLPAGVLSEVVERLDEWFAEETRSSLLLEREAVMFSADRAGLLASGSPLVAITALSAIGKQDRCRVVPIMEYSASRYFSRVLARSAG